jgi:uncharacterized nucleotidyltransferase DUF6036
MKSKLDDNFCELRSAFRACSVRYLIIDGWAVSIARSASSDSRHGHLAGAEPADVQAISEAFSKLGAPLENIARGKFLEAGTSFRVGAQPCQIFPEIPEVRFADGWPKRVEVPLNTQGLSASFISADDLIAAKLASGREQDIADARAIPRAKRKESK